MRALVIGIVAAAVVAVAYLALAPQPTHLRPVSYSQFLADVQAGRVTSVTQTDEIVSYTGPQGELQTVVPSVLTDVGEHIQAAAAAGGQPVPAYTKHIQPDTSALPLLLAGSVLALVVLGLAVAWLVRRRGGGGPGNRLRILDDALRAGLLTPDEYEAKRRRLRGSA